MGYGVFFIFLSFWVVRIGFFKLSDGLMIATCPVPYEFGLALLSHNSLLGSVEMFVKDV